MKKGELTRQNIVKQAMGLASQLGLDGVSIGSLADRLALSKSGLFAHFKSKEALQMQILETAAAHFSGVVVRPAVKVERGEPRVRALFENWLEWAKTNSGGCIFVAASVELDDRSGPVRDCLLRLQNEWQEVRRRIFLTGVERGHFRADVDAHQFAFNLYGILLAYHHAARLIKDPNAEKHAREAFETLLRSVKKESL